MGLKDMFRRKASKGDDAKATPESDPPVRQRQDATVMMPMPGSEPAPPTGSHDATVAIPVPPNPGARQESGEAARSPDDTTERLVQPDTKRNPSDAAATVAVPIPGFVPDQTPRNPAAELGATVAVAIPDFRKDTSAPASADDVGATIAIAIPDFDGAETAPVGVAPEAAENFAATVAVAIPNFEAPEAMTPGRVPEASAPDMGASPVSASVAFDSPLPNGPAEDYLRDATRFDLSDANNERPEVVGVLVAIDGELAGLICPIPDGETKIGRGEDCDVMLPSMKISREHTTIVHHEGVFAILPLSDKNPTYVNDEVVSGCELSDGDSVRMGRTTFRFRTIEGL